MRLQDIGGEFGFIERLRGPHGGAPGQGLAVPIGDDAAVLDAPPGRQIVVTTDMLVEGVHFRRDWSDPYSIGWKAAAVNLSDIAAMGADPTFAFLSLALTPQETVENLDRLLNGLGDCLTRYGARLAGGDTNATPGHLVVNVTLLGSVPQGRALTRAGARLGDVLLVTGTLGQSSAGLALLTQHGHPKAEKLGETLVNAHRRPQPRVSAGLAAARTLKVHACMDLSDGLLGDVPKLCAASGGGARLDTALLPVSDELRRACELQGTDPLMTALHGGEDYELLLAVAPADVDAVRAAVEATGVPLTAVGEVTKAGLRILAADGQNEMTPQAGGWDHFAPPGVPD